MASVHTSVPRRPTTDPGVDESGRAFGIMTFGPVARFAGEVWARRVDQLDRPVLTWAAGSAAEAVPVLARWLAEARVGFRLMFAGPEADLLTARAQAAVLLDAELRLLVTDTTHRPVWCVHCGTTTLAESEIGAVTPCAGCARPLVVHHHVSRHHGSYLGYLANAEER
jgi:hypothetical protein